jgi:hypothetical protein
MTETPKTSVAARLTIELNKIAQFIEKNNPDSTHNTGRMIGQAYLWDIVESIAKKHSNSIWDRLEKDGVISRDNLDPGAHELADTPHFVLSAKVTNPVRRFDDDEMAHLLKKSKYKVPEPITKQFIDQAKIPKKSTVTMTITEKGI